MNFDVRAGLSNAWPAGRMRPRPAPNAAQAQLLRSMWGGRVRGAAAKPVPRIRPQGPKPQARHEQARGTHTPLPPKRYLLGEERKKEGKGERGSQKAPTPSRRRTGPGPVALLPRPRRCTWGRLEAATGSSVGLGQASLGGAAELVGRGWLASWPARLCL